MIVFEGIKARNFMSFKELDLNLDNQGIVAIEGINKTNPCFISNGAGKSTPMEAFAWGVFGETIRTLDSVEEVVNDKVGKDCSVYIPFRDNDGVSWEIRRHRNHHEFKNKVLLFREGEEWTKDVKIQEKINTILGIDFKSFKSAFIFYNDGTKPFSASTDSEQKKLLEKLFDLEKYTALQEITKIKLKAMQTQLYNITATLTNDRRELDRQTVEISNLERLERDFLKDIEAKVNKFNYDIDVLNKLDNSELVTKLSTEINSALKELEDLKLDDTVELVDELKGLKEELSKLQAVTDFGDIDTLRKEADALQKASVDSTIEIARHKHDVQKLETERVKYEKGLGIQYPTGDVDYTLSINLTQAKIKELCDKKTKFEKGLGGECTNCNQEITDEYKQKHVDEIRHSLDVEGEQLLRLGQQRDSYESAFREQVIMSLSDQLEKHAVELAKLEEQKQIWDIDYVSKRGAIDLIEEEKKVHRKKESELWAIIDKKSSILETKKNTRRSREDALNRQIEDNRQKLGSIEMQKSSDLMKISMLEKQREQVSSTINPYTAMIEAKSQEAVSLFDKIEQAGLEEKELETQIKHYQFFETAFSRSGIQSYLLDNIIPVLNKYALHYSKLLSGGSLHIEFYNQSLSKSGDLKEKFGVKVQNRDGSRSYGGDSSGERRRVDLITLFALQKASMLRSKSKFNVLFIDEVFDSLDPAGIENVIHILEDETTSFPSIFLISHNPEVGGLLDSTITIKKENGFSSLVAL